MFNARAFVARVVRWSLPALSLLAASHAGAQAAAAPESELESLGWHVAQAATDCVLVQPELSARDAVWLSVHRPAALPRPAFLCGTRRMLLPVSPDPALLERMEGPPPTASWAVRAAGQVRGTFAAVQLDFVPYLPERPAETPNLLGELPPELGQPLLIPPRPVRDPALRGRASKYNRVPEPPTPPQPPALVVQVVTEGLREDGLHATADGTRWVTLSLAPERALPRHGLKASRVFGGDGRLFVAPRALQFDAATVLLAVDPATGAVTSLGRPSPPEAGHWVRITDARDAGGVVEALVVVDHIAPTGLTSPWGLLARREAGTWSFPERYFTPAEKGALPELRFDDADPSTIWLHAGAVHASRPMRSTAATPLP